MKFLLDELNQKSYADLKLIFLKIPLHEDNITIQSTFNKHYFSSQYIHQFFSYLPEHVHTIQFQNSGFFGDYLAEMIASLPPCFHTIKMNFMFPRITNYIGPERYKLIMDMRNVFKNIPKHIQTLDFSAMSFTEIPGDNEEILASIPTHVKKIHLPNLEFGKLSANARRRLLSYIPKTIESLNFESNYLLNNRSISNLIRMFDGQYPNIKSLSLAGNDLSLEQNPIFIRSIMSSIIIAFPNLKHLNLRDNRFGCLVRDVSFAQSLQVIPASVSDLDLGENGLFAYGIIKFFLAFQDLPISIKAIDLGDNVSRINLDDVQKCIFSLPMQIEILRMTEVPFMGLTAENFGLLIKNIPPHVHTFDISKNKLNTKNIQEIIQVFKEIPAHVHTLVLKNNQLVNFSIEHFRAIMKAVPKTIKCLDLLENGFECLNHSLLNRYLDTLPEIEVILDFSKISLNVGQGVMNTPLALPNTIRPRKLYHQTERAQMLIGLAQIFRAKKIPLSCVEHIGSFILGKQRQQSFIERVKHISTQMNVSPQTGKLYQNLDTISCARRESARKLGYSILDYSMMGFFLSDKINMIDAIKNIPQSIRCVNLSYNCCPFTVESRQRTQDAFQFFPAHVELIDLRGNGFEFMEPNHLNQWFGQIPAHIKILLTQEIPTTLTHYLIRLDVPEFYRTMIGNYTKFLDKAQILLNDYTQGDSSWMRLLMGYWNRNHIQDVDRVVLKIQQGLIENIRDVFHEFMKISLKNESGALAKSLMFLILELERAENGHLEKKVLMMSRR